MTAPALGAITAAIAAGAPLPEEAAARGITAAQLSPGRLL